MYEDNLVKMTAERLRSDLLTKLLWSLVPVRLVEGPGKLSLSSDHSCMGGREGRKVTCIVGGRKELRRREEREGGGERRGGGGEGEKRRRGEGDEEGGAGMFLWREKIIV